MKTGAENTMVETVKLLVPQHWALKANRHRAVALLYSRTSSLASLEWAEIQKYCFSDPLTLVFGQAGLQPAPNLHTSEQANIKRGSHKLSTFI